MRRIKVKTSREYNVLVGSGAIEYINEELKAVLKAKRILIVTDDNVEPLHLKGLKERLEGSYLCFTHILKNGEENKNIDAVLGILSELQKNEFDRDDAVVALGGGVVGDISAFSASIYMRGIDFINIPTTLLSQVDSSVGGKTGVDFGGAKNIVGSFYQPKAVICDTDFFKTLPDNIFADGCAEVIKYAFINDKELLEVIEDGIKKNIDDIVYRCVSDKNDVVSNDEFDRGLRGLLNFGHTVGHAVESLSSYKISHGSAVSIGMRIVTEAFEKAGACKSGVCEKLVSVLKENNLPIECGFSAEDIINAVRKDKKKSGDSISVIVPKELCKCEIEKMSFEKLYSVIKEVNP
ncbi:MAG: 3-dehydroquinate synthase [Clostridia bacterium]|nr:3-dehydroquinate synthase [Clostridia bacterium]